jgi:DNA polymerase-3 subunit gamma/tau
LPAVQSHLDNILGQEAIEFEAPALRLLAQGAHGSMRDALSLTDQAIAYAAGKVTLEAVQGMLGALDQSYLIRVLDALAAQDGGALLAVADEMATRSLSYNAALQDLATLLHQIALAQTVPAALAEDTPQREDIVRLAAQFNPEEAQLFYQIAVHGRNELGLAPDEYAGFSMTLLRMLAFRPVAAGAAGAAASAPAAPARAPGRSTPTVAPLSAAPQVAVASAPVARPAPASGGSSARAAALEAARAASGKRAAAPAVTAPVVVASAPAEIAPAPDEAPPPWDDEPAAAAAQKKTEQSSSTAGTELNAPAEPIVVTAPPVSTVTPAMLAQTAQVAAALEWDGNWPQLAAALPLRGMVQQMAQQSEMTHCEMTGNTVCFHLRVPVETLRAAGNIEKLCTVLGERFGRSVRVETEIGVVANTANAKAEADRAERQREAELTVQQDPFVQVMMREFGASIVPGSIRPL